MLEVLQLFMGCIDTLTGEFQNVELCKIQPRKVNIPSEQANLIMDLHLQIEGMLNKFCVKKCWWRSISTFSFSTLCKVRNKVYLTEL